MALAVENPVILELTLRGVEISEEVVGYARRRTLRLSKEFPELDWPARVRLERLRPDGPVRADVATTLAAGVGEDLDEMLALSSAFEVLGERLARHTPSVGADRA